MRGSSESVWKRSASSRAINSSIRSEATISGKGRKQVMFQSKDNLRIHEGVSLVREQGVRGSSSLRRWLDNPDRRIDELECLDIFRQIVEIVNVSHSKGFVVRDVRPSCFLISSSNRVSFLGPKSSFGLGSDSLDDDGKVGKDFNLSSSPMFSLSEEPSVFYGDEGHGDSVEKRRNFDFFEKHRKLSPMKGLLVMERSWYTSPEELAGSLSSCASDIYCLGVLLFELFCPFGSREEKNITMSSMRHRVLPPKLLLDWPREASFCLLLLHPDPSVRPQMSVVLQSEFLNQVRKHLEERDREMELGEKIEEGRDIEMELEEKIEEHELLLEFLLLMQQQKKNTADKLQDRVGFLCKDIEEVSRLHSFPQLGKEDQKDLHLLSGGIVCSGQNHSLILGSRKRSKPRRQYQSVEESVDNEIQESDSGIENKENLLSSSHRLMKNFKKLEAAYFSTRCCPNKGSAKHLTRQSPLKTNSGSITGRSGVDDDRRSNGWVSPFLEGLCKYVAFSKLKVKAELKQGDLLNSSNLVCSLSFDRDGELFASAGVNKKIKVFECNAILEEGRDIHYPVAEMASRSKLSSICWNTYIKSHIASSNFEGVVQVWDVTRSQVLAELREHEKRVWSVDFSTADPTMLASGSDDGSVKLWNINQGASIHTIKTKANVCSVQFPPDSSRMLAFGSADHKIYYYDLRNSRFPLCTLAGHNKTVSYVKFLDSVSLVSSSTDNTLKLWDVSQCTSRVVETPVQTFSGHTNVKNFVGLSVSDGYIATGSETNEVVVYHKAFPMPLLSHKFNSTDSDSSRDTDSSSLFVSSVCWNRKSSTMVAATSNGDIQILEMA